MSRAWELAGVSHGRCGAGHLAPCLEGSVACGSIGGDRQAVTAELDVVVDAAMGGEEALGVAR